MKQRNSFVIILIITFLLIGLLANNFLFRNECEKSSAKLNFAQITSYHLTYQKDSFEVQREWIKISQTETPTNITAFIYYPVLSATNRETENLPNTQWQAAHFETIRKKIGDSIAVKMIKTKVKLAIYGKLPEKKFPLIIFGPGLGWLPTDYTLLLVSLASRGFIVVALTGIPISKQVYFPDNTSENTKKIKADYFKMANYFSLALTEILNKRDKEKDDIYSLIDTSKVIVAGHSVSGAASLITANNSQQIKAIINLDGDVNDEFKKIQPTQPILYITTQPQGVDNLNIETWSKDKSEKRRDNAFDNNAKRSIKSIRIKIPEMYHLDFLDAAYYKEKINKACNRKSFGHIPFSKSLEIITESIVSFIEKRENWKTLESRYGIYVRQR